jgi:hypothetical protein
VKIAGGRLATDCGGTIEVVAMNGDDNNMSVFDGSHGHAVTIDGYVLVDAGANLELKGAIQNEGTIAVGMPEGGDDDPNLIIDGKVDLTGGGTVNLFGHGDNIIGASGDDACNVLVNCDDAISGAGKIGGSEADLTLINKSAGTIDADIDGQTLTIDTGRAVVNDGLLEATDGGKLLVKDSVDSCGSGYALIKDGTVEFDAATNTNVKFDNASGYGELILGDVKDFSGQILDFAGRGSAHPSLANTDEIDLVGINKNDVTFCKNGDNAEIVINQGSIHTTITIVDFNFEDLEKKSDGAGGTLIYDPPAANSTTPSVSLGSNDSFVFHPGEGAQTISNFNPQNETIELDHFANIQNVQELTAAISSDAQGNAVLELGHGDSVAIPGVSATFLQQHLQSLVHLH